MIDKFKKRTYDLQQIHLVWNNPLLLYKNEEQYRVDDEVRLKETRTYKNLTFVKYFNHLEIYGSIHYYSNNGKHNANDLSALDCIEAFEDLIQKFDIIPQKFEVINLEYGYNIQGTENVNEVLSNLRFFGRKLFKESIQYRNFFEAGSTYKLFKIYNKTQDCKGYADPDTSRIELKSNESKFIKSLGINSLSDLLEIDTYNCLHDSLMNEWGSVILFDFDLVELKEYHITEYWLNIIKTMHRNSFINKRNEYHNLLPENSLYNRIKNKLQSKGEKLLNCAFSTSTKNDTIVHFPTITKLEYAQPSKHAKYCVLTQLDISMQKEESIMISHTGLKYYYNTDKAQFKIIKNKYLSKKWINADFETQIKELGHNIRNKVCNQRTAVQKKCISNQMNLFN